MRRYSCRCNVVIMHFVNKNSQVWIRSKVLNISASTELLKIAVISKIWSVSYCTIVSADGALMSKEKSIVLRSEGVQKPRKWKQKSTSCVITNTIQTKASLTDSMYFHAAIQIRSWTYAPKVHEAICCVRIYHFPGSATENTKNTS